MRFDILEPAQRHALSALSPAAKAGFYLAGGTALSVQLQHRRSVDIDLFRTELFDADEVIRALQIAGVVFAHLRTAPATVHGDVNGVRTSLLAFPYPLLEPPEPSEAGIPVAGLRDIAAMKIEAIASRGMRKDFYDLYFVCQAGLGLDGALDAFRSRFASASPDMYHRLRSLTFFDDAEREPDPMLIKPATWPEVRSYFEQEVRRIWTTSSI